MNTISTLEHLIKNIFKFNTYQNGTIDEMKWFHEKLNKGTCFVPYLVDGVVTFSPSRFVGYTDNNMQNHDKNKEKDGRITTPIISKILGTKPIVSSKLDDQFKIYCKSFGFIPNDKGSFGVQRKYWISNEFSYLLEQVESQDIENDSTIEKTVKVQLINARIGQGKYREDLIKVWNGKCSITEIEVTNLLIASHIKPWRDSNNEERLDPYNGLLLTPNADALFDNGLISFTDEGTLLVSKNISIDVITKLIGTAKLKIKLKPNNLKYMKIHRENIFG